MDDLVARIDDLTADDYRVVWRFAVGGQIPSQRIGIVMAYLDQTAAQARHPLLEKEPTSEQLNLAAFVINIPQAKELIEALEVAIDRFG